MHAASAPTSPVLIRFGRLGDTVLLQPLLHKLRLRYGRPCRLLAAGDWPTRLYAACEDVERVVAFRSEPGLPWQAAQGARAVQLLRQWRGAPVYVGEHDPQAKAKLLPMLALAGMPADHCVFATDLPAWPREHEVERLLRLGGATPAAFSVERYPDVVVAPMPQLQASAADRDDAGQWLLAHGLDARRAVLLQPGNRLTRSRSTGRGEHDDAKAWPIERWRGLAQAIRVQQPELRLVLCGAPAEASYLEAIQAAIGSGAAINAAAELPLPRLIGLLALAHSMVSVDTGPAHLAAALGCPLVTLFGPLPAWQWAPRGPAATSALGGASLGRRVDEIALEPVLAAWRALPPRQLSSGLMTSSQL